MNELDKYYDKYKPVPDSRGILRRPAGGNDIVKLCDAINEMLLLIRDVQRDSTVDVENKIEMRLHQILRKLQKMEGTKWQAK